MSKKIVVKLHLQDNKDKQKAIKAVSALTGIDEISVDMASHKMTVIGMVDPVSVVSKLRKASWSATIDSVGPAKEPEPEKKEGEKKDDGGEAKKDGGEGDKKDGEGEKKEGEEEKKKEGDDKEKDGDGKKEQALADLMNQYRAYYQYYPYPPPVPVPMAMPSHYLVRSMEEDPNSCTIC